MQNCEMCGKATEDLRRVLVDKTPLRACSSCARFGKDLAPPPGVGKAPGVPTNVAAALDKRRRRMSSRDVFGTQSMALELVDDFGAQIQAAREKKGLTRQQLGARIKEPENAVARMESGALHPTDATARRLERQLGITLLEAPQRTASRPRAAAGLTIGDLLKPSDDEE